MWHVAGFGTVRHHLSQFLLLTLFFDHRHVIVNSGPLEGPCSEVSDDVLRPVAAVECPGRKAKRAAGRSSEQTSNCRTSEHFLEKAQNHVEKRITSECEG